MTTDDDKIDRSREEYRNARERLNQQSSIFSEFTKEGQRMIRITLIYAGLLITGGSYLLSGPNLTSFSRSPVIEDLLILSGICLLGSLIFHTVGREVRGVKTIYEPDENKEGPREAFDTPEEYYEDKIKEYSDRIKYNKEVLDIFESNLGEAKGLLLISLTLSSWSNNNIHASFYTI